MICQQVTLSGYAEWPKVADAVIEAPRFTDIWERVRAPWPRLSYLSEKQPHSCKDSDAQEERQLAKITCAFLTSVSVSIL
jgi:hypothetical protein